MAIQKGGLANKRQQMPAAEDSGAYVSGRLVIITIVILALAAAGFSWWFRYTSTRRAARFWGDDAVRLIRDAPTVYLLDLGPMDAAVPHAHDPDRRLPDHFHAAGGLWTVSNRRDISQAHGLTHLRNHLLLDRNLGEAPWGAVVGEVWRTGLEFHSDEGPPLVILLSPDCSVLLRHLPGRGDDRAQRMEAAMAAGMRTVFAEWRSPPGPDAANRASAYDPFR
jgi:hypothetical protein